MGRWSIVGDCGVCGGVAEVKIGDVLSMAFNGNYGGCVLAGLEYGCMVGWAVGRAMGRLVDT